MTTYNQALKDAVLVCNIIADKIKRDAYLPAEKSRADYAKELLNVVSNAISELEPGLLKETNKIP